MAKRRNVKRKRKTRAKRKVRKVRKRVNKRKKRRPKIKRRRRKRKGGGVPNKEITDICATISVYTKGTTDKFIVNFQKTLDNIVKMIYGSGNSFKSDKGKPQIQCNNSSDKITDFTSRLITVLNISNGNEEYLRTYPNAITHNYDITKNSNDKKKITIKFIFGKRTKQKYKFDIIFDSNDDKQMFENYLNKYHIFTSSCVFTTKITSCVDLLKIKASRAAAKRAAEKD